MGSYVTVETSLKDVKYETQAHDACNCQQSNSEYFLEFLLSAVVVSRNSSDSKQSFTCDKKNCNCESFANNCIRDWPAVTRTGAVWALCPRALFLKYITNLNIIFLILRDDDSPFRLASAMIVTVRARACSGRPTITTFTTKTAAGTQGQAKTVRAELQARRPCQPAECPCVRVSECPCVRAVLQDRPSKCAPRRGHDIDRPTPTSLRLLDYMTSSLKDVEGRDMTQAS
jgi:hypothetical protein